MVELEQVGILVGHADARIAGGLGAGIVCGHEHALRIFIGDAHLRVDLALFLAHPERHFDLLGWAFVGELNVLGHLAQIRRLALLERGQGSADVGDVEVLVASDDDLAQNAFDYVEAHDAGGQFLLRHEHLHRAETRPAVGAFEGFERLLDVPVYALGTHQRRNDALHLRIRQQRVALDLKTHDIEALVLRHGGRNT